MEKHEVTALISSVFADTPGDVLGSEDDVREEYYGTRMFDAPLVGFGSAADPLFAEYKKPDIIGPWHMSPDEWLPEAKSIVSLFFPISEEIRRSNREASEVSSVPWAYARIEGQAFIGRTMAELKKRLEAQGVRCCVPALDPRFAALKAGKGIEGYPVDIHSFGSRWSERHAAYVCGLGTFGLSKGLITRKGVAGRFASILTDLPLEADSRPYTGIYDYCIQCGACIVRCPVGAIDPETGKDHLICAGNLQKSGVVHAPRYGCALCNTGVPCEFEIPKKQ